jgi:hypothetical protein
VKLRITRVRRPSRRGTAAILTAVAIVATGACLRGSGAWGPDAGQRQHAVAMAAATEDPSAASSASSATGTSGAAINPDWASLHALFTASPSSGDEEGLYQATGTGDDGIVLLRVFIPAQNAAGNLLLGDDRGFTDDPSAPFRAEVAWDTSTGKVAFVVRHSAVGPLLASMSAADNPSPPLAMGDPIAALPILSGTDWNQAFAVRDQVRSDNRVGIDASAPSGELHIRLSLLNPLTNSDYPPGFGLGAWSVDQEATLSKTAAGTYQLALAGNGYPALEAYYYPHYADTSATGGPSSVIAKRSVEPAFLGKPLDAGGGMAALDSNSWVQCADSAPGAFRCQNTITTTTTINPEGSGATTITGSEPAWTTTDQQTSAM